MNKTETTEVMNAFADCLRILYTEAGIEIPAEFHPEKEAERLKLTLRGYKEFPCGCFAGVGEVPNFCPEHGEVGK